MVRICPVLYNPLNMTGQSGIKWRTGTPERRKFDTDRRHRLKAFLWGYKSLKPCVDCGENDPDVLEFDHEHGKRLCVSMMSNYSTAEVLAEIAKCRVRCANCHRRITLTRRKEAGQLGWRPHVVRPPKTVKE